MLSFCGRLVSGAIAAGRHRPYLTYPLLTLLAAGLLTGSVTLLLRVGRTRRLVRRLTDPSATAMPPKLATALNELGLTGRVDLVASERLYSFCYGFLRPRICLTVGLVHSLSQAELRAVLLHEENHLRSYDPLKSLMADTLTASLFFVPLLAELRKNYRRARELAADDSAIQAGRLALAGALCKLLTHPLSLDLESPEAVGVLSVIDQRLMRIVGQEVMMPRRIPKWRIATSLLLVAFVLFTLWTAPASISSSTPAAMIWHSMEPVPEAVTDAYCTPTLNASCCLANGTWPFPSMSLLRRSS